MKYAISLILLFCIGACHDKLSVPQHSTSISIVVDRTDPFLLLPKADPILVLYGLADDKEQEAFFRISTITDKQINPTAEYHLPNGTMTEKENMQDDPQYREKIILRFYNAVSKAITESTSIQTPDSSLQYSECFSTIAKELGVLQKSYADTKELLVFSDAQENSNIYNCYRGEIKPDEVITLFTKTHLLPESLKGITVFFIYLPKDRNEDMRYSAMVRVYQTLLEARGATVIIQATNNYKL